MAARRDKRIEQRALAAALAERGRAVPEELALSELVGDLKSRLAHRDRAQEPIFARLMMSVAHDRMRS
jgi:hypothetical protein